MPKTELHTTRNEDPTLTKLVHHTDIRPEESEFELRIDAREETRTYW